MGSCTVGEEARRGAVGDGGGGEGCGLPAQIREGCDGSRLCGGGRGYSGAVGGRRRRGGAVEIRDGGQTTVARWRWRRRHGGAARAVERRWSVVGAELTMAGGGRGAHRWGGGGHQRAKSRPARAEVLQVARAQTWPAAG
jgi:hypothetical protein